MSLQIIGAGFGRTGTLSLKAALEQLGFEKCHHMFEVATEPGQLEYWHALSQGQKPDWNEVFEGYRSSCDFPSCVYWQELHEHFPESKVILSTRQPERWYQSVSDTIYPISKALPKWLTLFSSRARKHREMIHATIWDGVFDGRFEDQAHALQVFAEHEARVKATVAPERLLVFEAKQGWEPLCAFLDVPVPDEPYPHLNDTATTQAMARRIRRLRYVPWVVGALLLGIGFALAL